MVVLNASYVATWTSEVGGVPSGRNFAIDNTAATADLHHGLGTKELSPWS